MQLIKKTQNYVKEVIQEMKRVNWPTWEDLKNSTRVVIVSVLIITVFIFVIDQILSTLVKQIVGM